MADIVKGTINTESIYNTHRMLREMVTAFHNSQIEVGNITQSVRDNWVGEGRNEFETQYKILIRKIDDFGETIKDIYNALVESEQQYEESDVSVAQQFKSAMDK